MVYKSVSIDIIIGKIIRDTRIQDASYIVDMHEWIPEVMAAARWEAPLHPEYLDITVNLHKGKLPCGLIYIDAVEHCGRRLPHGNSVRNIRATRAPAVDPNAPFISVITRIPVPDSNLLWSSTLVQANQLPFHEHAYYQLDTDYLLTSFECGQVRIHYRTTPHDERGLPLIPDNQAFKEALYWYVRSKMIGAGYLDKVFKEETCYERYNTNLERALCEIDFPSPDMMEERVNTFARFIPPEHYYQNFFQVSEPEHFRDPMGYARSTIL